jgi:hypothetical protein
MMSALPQLVSNRNACASGLRLESEAEEVLLAGAAVPIPDAAVAEEPTGCSLACCALALTPITEALNSAQKNLDFI